MLVPEAQRILNGLMEQGLTINKSAGILKIHLLPSYLTYINLDGSGLNGHVLLLSWSGLRAHNMASYSRHYHLSGFS